MKISPEVSGEIIELPVKEGQTVKKGDLLVKIKPDPYVAARNSTEAGYKASQAGQVTAEANLQRAKAEYLRIEALYQKDKLVSESAFVEVQTAYEVAKAQAQSARHQVEMADASLRRAEDDLRKTTVLSPLDGIVIRLNSQLGERVVGTAMMAGTEMMVIADLDKMEARVDIGEIDVVLIQVGQNAKLDVDAFKDRKFAGEVTEIANSSKGLVMGGGMGGSSQDATKFEVKILIKDKAAFRPGMTVTADIETRSRTNVLTVPIASVTTRLPKPPAEDKRGRKKATNEVARAAAGASGGSALAAAPTANTNAPTTTTAATTTSTTASNTTNIATAAPTGTNAISSGTGTNAAGVVSGKKPGEKPKPIEVVFLKVSERAKMLPVKLGISDDSYTEITEGVAEGDEVISGGFKAISKELEDEKKVRIGKPVADEKEKGKEPEKK